MSGLVAGHYRRNVSAVTRVTRGISVEMAADIGCRAERRRLRQHLVRPLLRQRHTACGGFLVALQDATGSGKADVKQRFGATVQSGGAGGTGIGWENQCS
jgi:hypothetical protein